MARRPTRLGLRLDPSQPVALYQQVFDAIVERIRSGAFPAGFRLPPTRVLAAELDAHRNTVVRAYLRLEEAGFVTSAVGRGTFVRAPAASRAASLPASSSSPVDGAPGLPWASLVSSRVRAEPFGRIRRLARAAAPFEHVNLTRLQPGPDLLPEALFRRCLEHVLRLHGGRALGYGPHEGVPALRAEIAKDLSRRGVPAREEDVVVTSGSQQAIDVVARALLEPGDAVLLDEATYTGALQIFTAAGARSEPVAADADGPVPAALERAASRGAKLAYLMPGHSNPTGRRIAEARRLEIVRWSRARGVPLLEDDFNADLELDPEPVLTSLRALDGDVIHVGTFSKKLMPALRIGYLLCPAPLREPLVALKHATALGTSTLLQFALAEFLERGYLEPHLDVVRAAYRARRDALAGALERHLPGSIRFEVPPRGVTIWIPLPDELPPEVVFDAARRAGVLVSPGSMYRVGDGARGVRLCYSWETEARLVEGGRRLGQAISALLRERRGRSAPAEPSVGLV